MPIRLLFIVGVSGLLSQVCGSEVRFSRDIRPLLSDRCFKCHGFDEADRKAGLGLHSFAEATRSLGGYAAIVPGDPEASELLHRITSPDPDEIMPPPSANKPAFSDEEVDLIRRWIQQGARYEEHWAFVPPKRAAVSGEYHGHPVDFFVDRKLEEIGLAANDSAEPPVLLRRLSLDLRGYPPSLEETEAFTTAFRENEEKAWTSWVDRFLASPAYGEKWAREWLDLARYADTNGYEKDRPRSIWPYRDWVIEALNRDIPYDRFSIEQLAGDMLPGASPRQWIATGFHRNTMLNEEGGIDPLEFRYHAMVDRVATTGTVWMGLTTGCAQCHTHKFDPITHQDYFAMMALLDNADEPEIEVHVPEIAARRGAILEEIARLEDEAIAAIPEEEFRKFRDTLELPPPVRWTALKPAEASAELPRLDILDDDSILARGDFRKREVYRVRYQRPDGLPGPITALRLEVLPHPSLPARGPGVAYYEGRKGDFFLSELTARVDGETLAFRDASTSFGKISVGKGAAGSNVYDGDGSTGWSTSTREGERHELVLVLSEPVPVGAVEVELLFERHFVAALGRFRLGVTADRGEVRAYPGDLPAPDAGVREWKLAYLDQSPAPDLAARMKKIAARKKTLPPVPTTLVMQERPADHPRGTLFRHRGDYTQPRHEVEPAVPAIFPQLPENEPADRLALARWLVGPDNPLAARVAVNRAWRSFFGQGIVPTEGDFGYQSELPSHPDLLDWLAVDFRESGWSKKRLHRTIVTSRTYRRHTRISPEQREVDPENRYLARGPRFRMTGEMIRDSALQAAGLLHHQIGGPSVRPPQPASVTSLAWGDVSWNPSEGKDRYRRSLYTFSKRTAPFAAYLAFDGPTGETCLPRRERSNTPLQALTLLNDEMFLEAARGLAQLAAPRLDRARSEPQQGDEAIAVSSQDALETLFRRVLTRPPTSRELDRLTHFFRRQTERIASGTPSAAEILPGEKEADPQLAALALTARVILNLDEAITKE